MKNWAQWFDRFDASNNVPLLALEMDLESRRNPSFAALLEQVVAKQQKSSAKFSLDISRLVGREPPMPVDELAKTMIAVSKGRRACAPNAALGGADVGKGGQNLAGNAGHELMHDLQQAIREEAARLGFVSCGFARADAAPDAGRRSQAAGSAAGYHGTMGWMEARADAARVARWPVAARRKSVIALAMSYAPATDPLALAGVGDRGRISAYAQGGDYHKTVKKGLKALARFIVDRAPSELKVFVDTAPVMEKPLAAAAGIGWQGKHSNLVSRGRMATGCSSGSS